MIEQAIGRLRELARTDSTVALLALLHAEALRASADRVWEEGLPSLEDGRLQGGPPLLHGQAPSVDPGRVQRLLEGLAAVAARAGHDDAEPLRRAFTAGAVNPLAVLEASIGQDAERLETIAAEAGADLALLATLGQLAALPLLQACGRQAAPLLERAVWEAGYCPVCAAWPTLAELRGLERRRRLRCGRCGADWSFHHLRCAFCATIDHRVQGYLAPEAEREARRAVTCDQCHGYLKTLATISPIPPAEIGIQDLLTLELDIAALERGYGRPTAPGFPLRASVEPARRRTGWLAWMR